MTSSDSCPLKSATTISHVNDDCLRAVFENLDVRSLCAVADVCVRFRQNAKLHFKNSEHCNWVDNVFVYASVEEKLIQTSKFLRNFGEYIKTIATSGEYGRILEMQPMYQRSMCELLSLYCSGGALTGVKLFNYFISEEIALVLQPALAGIHKLELFRCKWGDLLLRKLPTWSAELLQLNLVATDRQNMSEPIMCYDGLHQSYGKLLELSLYNVNEIRSNNIDEFVMRNQQLKKLIFKHCVNLDDSFLQSIVAHLPQLETLRWKTDSSPNEFNIQYFGRMTNLTSLELGVFHQSAETYITRVIREISAARIPLEHLRVSIREFRSPATFVYGIESLNTLKELEILCLRGLNAENILYMCEKLRELETLRLDGNCAALNLGNLLRLMGSGEKMINLHLMDVTPYFENEIYCIDTNTYLKFVEILQQRHEKKPFTLTFTTQAYAINVPKELIEKYQDVLTYRIAKRIYAKSFDSL